ncbi:MAG: glycosyltransferase family 2 protein [Chloroflexota bacterium]
MCIPAYNRSVYLRQAIESVLAQTYRDFELLVVDDCSTDDTAAVATTAAAHDPRVRYVRNPHNLGMVGNWNRCLDLARGEYVGILHHDDAYLPTMLEATVGVLDAHPAGFAYGVAEEVDDAGRPVGLRRSRAGNAVLPPAAAFAHLLAFNSVPFPTTLVRAEAYATLGRFDETIGFAVDWDMWLRLTSRYPVAYIDRALARYRLTDWSETKRYEIEGTAAASLRATLRKALAAPPQGQRPPYRTVWQARTWIAGYELSIAFHFLYRNDYQAFRRHTLAALTFAPHLVASPQGLTALAMSVASLAGSRGPQLLWRLRDRLPGARPEERRYPLRAA